MCVYRETRVVEARVPYRSDLVRLIACGRPLASHTGGGYGWVAIVCRYSERRGTVASWSLGFALHHYGFIASRRSRTG